MADQARTLSAAFPTPPPFYKHFTKENATQLRDLRRDPSSKDIDAASIPADLRNLLPPEPPTDGRYKSFGIQHDVRCCTTRSLLAPFQITDLTR